MNFLMLFIWFSFRVFSLLRLGQTRRLARPLDCTKSEGVISGVLSERIPADHGNNFNAGLSRAMVVPLGENVVLANRHRKNVQLEWRLSAKQPEP